MEKRIEIETSKTISRLVGNAYGQEVFEKQVRPNMDLNEKNVIVFPDYIEGIAISFIEGFLKMLPEEVSRRDFYQYFSIEGRDRVKNKFLDVVNMKL